MNDAHVPTGPNDPNDPADLTDTELLARLRADDPAAQLPPADPAEIDRLLQRVVDTDLRETGTRKRNRLTWLVAAAAVVVVAAGALWVSQSSRGHDDGGLVADPARTTTPAGPAAVSELTVPAAAAGRCMVPTPELLAAKPAAFRGTVLGIADGVATIRTTKVYAGQVADQVTVEGAASDAGGVEGDPTFTVGQEYLVAAADGTVVGCGLSGPVTADLSSLYEQAFAQ